MTKFALHKIETIKGKQVFSQLEINGIKQLDAFEKDLKDTTYDSEFKTIMALMDFVSNNRTLPSNKFKDITPQKESVKEYEFKTKHLRVYAIQQIGGKIIILGGYKNNQKKDIRSFRSIKKQYLCK